ncbi:helix-turn-helix domain-containing protein [Salinarimonas ramus]|uniref:Transcriptional regulator n=1 Tax=Salinarimonas ramus TaxID=690164 RepID=A0A917Q457_9HYPH|nr:helix-turn-helix domain-containing protein [Salinarimonas ramus]GGK19100.1 transcriptional regulator [Salinarimonas ramus]
MSDGGRKRSSTKQTGELDYQIGARMKSRRAELSMNQQSLAREIGVSYQQVQKYENGTDRIGAVRLWAVSRALNYPIGNFFVGEDGLEEAGTPYETDIEARRILSTEDGRALVQAFIDIEDTGVRRKLVELATTVAAAIHRPPQVQRRVRRMRKV